MEIPKTKEVKYGYACPCCGAILADNLDQWPLNLTVICSECDACFNSDNAVRKVQDIELEEPGKEYHGMIPSPTKVSVEGQDVELEEPRRDPIEYNPELSSSWFYVSGGPTYWKSDFIEKTGADLEWKTIPKTHDSIYKQIEDRCGVSHSALAEDIIQRDIPRVPQLYLALASKYMVRVGCKGDWRRDAEKALNYLTKALTGEWVGEGDSDDSE